MGRVGKISFNRDYVKGISRAKFIKQFEGVYPGADLGAEYDKIVPPAKQKVAEGDQVPKEG